MFLSISTTHRPATDLGYLLHKNPSRPQSLDLAFGRAQMFYPEASEERCTFALMLEVDPLALIRGTGKGSSGLLDQYVNDRPYAASSILAVAIVQTLRTAMGGRCAERPELVETGLPLQATVSPLPARGGRELIEALFAPLGYQVTVEPIPLDAARPEWGPSAYVTLKLAATCKLADLLTHLYVLIPVLDNKKHYYIGPQEIEKLLAKGGTWLPAHPARELIASRYLRRSRALATEAIARLAELSDAVEEEDAEATAAPEPDEDGIEATRKEAGELRLEKPLRLHEVRLDAVAEVLKQSGARRVLDLGCGNGKLLKRLLAERQFTEIVGVDIGLRDLEIAAKRVRLETMPEKQRERIKLLQGALTYRDARLTGYDAAALVEVIEHVDLDRLPAVERVVFECARPRHVVVTTPNRDFNVKFEGMAPGQLRHPDHRFEWTRAEFTAWTASIAERFGYAVRIEPLGDLDLELGAPSQMAIFTRGGA
jgi:3' terminal RNA ribose 2'-O-methyltransferase Hen1